MAGLRYLTSTSLASYLNASYSLSYLISEVDGTTDIAFHSASKDLKTRDISDVELVVLFPVYRI